jgi:tRNA (Thr-GGU) A37 N-methylase
MLKRKVGVFSTRSPHRPNPIGATLSLFTDLLILSDFLFFLPPGVTLARIERVDTAARTVHLSACDLVHGTPVLDIKVPFILSQ